jgi:hypothetical protein
MISGTDRRCRIHRNPQYDIEPPTRKGEQISASAVKMLISPFPILNGTDTEKEPMSTIHPENVIRPVLVRT